VGNNFGFLYEKGNRIKISTIIIIENEMSLYNLINKINPSTFFILPMLGKHPDKYPRFRDCFVEHTEQVVGGELGVKKESRPRKKGERFIYVYTRAGGGNREAYQNEIDKLRKHPNYISDKDDDFDFTYATFKFSVPEKWHRDYDLLVEGSGKLNDLSDEYKKQIDKVFPKLKGKLPWHNLKNK
jgi:hypothetical protein